MDFSKEMASAADDGRQDDDLTVEEHLEALRSTFRQVGALSGQELDAAVAACSASQRRVRLNCIAGCEARASGDDGWCDSCRGEYQSVRAMFEEAA